MRRLLCTAVATAALTVAAWHAGGPTLAAPKQDPFVRTTLFDNFVTPDGAFASTVLGDQLGGETEYTDYRWPDAGDMCVEGTLFPTGEPFIRLNRWVADGVRCTDEYPTLSRIYTIVVDNEALCAHSSDGQFPCHITPSDVNVESAPRIRAATAFKNKATATTAAFLFPHNGREWVIRTNGSASIQLGTGANTKILTYAGRGNATVFGVGDFADFALNFKIMFEKP